MKKYLVREFVAIISILILGVTTQAQSLKVGKVVANEYIVKMKAPSGQAPSAASQKAATEKGRRILNALGSDVQIKKQFSESRMIYMKSASASKVDFLKNHPDVEYVEPNYILSIDPKDTQAMGVPPTNADTYIQSYANTQVQQAWQIAKAYNHATPKTVVAVVDTGLDLNHGVFADSNSIWTNTAELNGQPGVDDDGNGYIDDVRGWNFVDGSSSIYDDADHGTHVAGIILGLGQDITEFPVRESRIQIMPLKFLDGFGSGTTADAIAAINYAVNNGARVINNSWGGPSYSQALNDAYANAYNHDVVLVTAAGNSGYNIDTTPMYPAAFDTPSNITVVATTDSDVKASFSNYSTTRTHVAAPGVSIISTVPGTGCSAPGCFQMMSGTSMAAPFVAGLAALVIREAPQLSAYQVKGIIMSQVDVFSVLAPRTQTSGRVNAYKAVQSAISNVGTTTWAPAYSASSRSIASEIEAAPKAGCGLVSTVASQMGSGGGTPPTGGSLLDQILVFSVILMPLLLALGLRRKATRVPARAFHKRQYERFNVVKDIIIKTGDMAIQAATDTLAVGGLSFKGGADLAQGQIVKVQIADHQEEIEAQIVWCQKNQAFGVKFLNISEALKMQMGQWTAGLTPT